MYHTLGPNDSQVEVQHKKVIIMTKLILQEVDLGQNKTDFSNELTCIYN